MRSADASLADRRPSTASGFALPFGSRPPSPSPAATGLQTSALAPPRMRGGLRGGRRSAGVRPGTVGWSPCFRRRGPCVFSAERLRSAVIVTLERFGAGIAGRCGVCHFRPRGLHPLDPFETKPGRAGAAKAPGLLRFKPEDSPFPCRRGEQPVLPQGPVPPPAPRRRRAASRNDHTRRTWLALAPDALPRDGMERIISEPPAMMVDWSGNLSGD